MCYNLLLLGILFLSGLASCTFNPRYTIRDINRLQKGMDTTSVLSSSIRKPFKVLSNPKMNLDAQVYRMFIGDYNSDYVLAFKNNKLFYWGFLYEFSRHNDAAINETGAWVLQELNK